MDHQPIKRLRFSYDPDARESVAGALAAACREHRLHRINSALEGGGIALSRIGSIQCAPPETIEHLARIMRTDATLIAAIAFTRSERRDRIVMGDLIAPRSVFDFERRWIGPISLGDEPFHRSAWLNRMLPYCPKSLELLVNACPTCGPLGWRTTRGIGFCEECREPIPPSTELPLPKTLADDYRLFADLMSRDAAVGAVAVHRLPDGIRSYSRTTLTGVAVRASIVSASGRGRWGVEKLVEQHPGMVATISATAAALLREWPKSVQRSIDARLAEIPGDLVAYEKLRRDIRWIANGSGEEGKQLVANAFPDIDGRKVRTFAKETRHYTATQAHTKLWTSSQELAVLRRADALRWDELPGGRRKRVRYDAHDVDELALLLLQSMSPEAVASRFEVPVYAVGQMLVFQLLIAQGHPGVLLLRGQQLDAAFLDAFAGRLDAAAIRAKPPQGF
ncbi:MAG: hypothetical protein K2Y05_04695, partial [Hyphomicrobiaceae bacterium]|nr:hypothetical protein [Hyphomicrobiaceae bacterium]